MTDGEGGGRGIGPMGGHELTATEFTGISAPYEAPTNAEIHVKTDEVDVAGAVAQIVEYLEKQGLTSA
jgi:adenylylsulfate kinase-like enzyme